MREMDVVIGLVCRHNQVLICQRRANDPLGDYWEFPGGKLELGESREQCLARELAEELAIEVQVIQSLDTIEYDYAAVRVRLHPYLCRHVAGEPLALASQQVAWATAADLQKYVFPPANDSLIRWLAPRLELPTDLE